MSRRWRARDDQAHPWLDAARVSHLWIGGEPLLPANAAAKIPPGQVPQGIAGANSDVAVGCVERFRCPSRSVCGRHRQRANGWRHKNFDCRRRHRAGRKGAGRYGARRRIRRCDGNWPNCAAQRNDRSDCWRSYGMGKRITLARKRSGRMMSGVRASKNRRSERAAARRHRGERGLRNI